VFDTPFSILSTGTQIFPFLFEVFSTSKIFTIEPLSFSTLSVQETMFLDAGSRRLGFMISSPQYDVDISGSLYYTTALDYSTINALNFSINKEVFYLSSLYYASSLIVKNDAILPPAPDPDPSQLPIIGLVNNSFFFPIPPQGPLIDVNAATLVLGEDRFPINETTFSAFIESSKGSKATGIFTNTTYSTLHLAQQLFIHNPTNQVGINTLGYIYQACNFTPTSIPSQYDLLVNGDMIASTIFLSTLTTSKLNTSSFLTPTFGMNPMNPSTLNLFSTSFYDNKLNNATLTINNTMSLLKNERLNGYCIIKSPAEGSIAFSSFFEVYNDAYVSSIDTSKVITDTFALSFQDL
jgi:hypothetical protein